ncbi:TRAP transporter substrate-binding protein [Thalassospira mesophila]|uniref:C4-dicarboxylate ABC transporter substrate-binding protein n=1 Tax=Thalassospira mesophila TaxID=1293891 RepID=A0A1Y2KY93_9PROT|nr:TRAP transporter substrate-binding protein [Thalassospira mesophila]OSQ37414.1 C4-dicarboxylate ABC transporter substrate-binding protein [Thalassospira mesophila]
MKNLTRTIIAASLSALVAAPASAETLRFGGNFAADHSSSIAMQKFKEAVETKTDGALTIDLFPDMQLGGAQENVDQTRSGAIFGTWIGAAYLSRTVPELEAISMPFTYPDRATAFRVIDGEVGTIVDQKLSDKGFKVLGWMELGPRNITNNVRPIKTVDDLKGLKIRLQPNQTHLDSFRAIGASPVSMGISEVYSALQQGVLDGEENPYSIIKTRRFDEVQKYLSDSNHVFDFITIVANKKAFDKLDPKDQSILNDAMVDAVAFQRAEAAKEDDTAKAALITAGMVFTPIPDDVRAKLRELTAPVIEGLKKRIDPALIEKVQSEVTAK